MKNVKSLSDDEIEQCIDGSSNIEMISRSKELIS